MTPKISRNITCRKCEGNIGEAVEQEENLCDDVETVQEFTYLGDRVSADGGCEAAVTARTRRWWAKPMECGEMLHGRRFPLKLKGAVYKSYIRLAIPHGSEVWRLEERDMRMLRTEKSMLKEMCGVHPKDRKRSKDLMLTLGLNEIIDQLAIANNVRWHCHITWREDAHVWRWALDIEVEGQRKKGRLKRTWKKQVYEEGVKVGLRREDALCQSKWSVGVNQIAAGLRRIWPPSLFLDTTSI